MKSVQMLAALVTGAVLLGCPAARAELLPPEKLANNLRLKAEELTLLHGKPGKRARALRALAARVSRMEAGRMPVDRVDKDGSTTLMLAAALGEEATVQYLLQRGASRECCNDKGKYAVDFAKSPGLRALLSPPEPSPEELEPADLFSQPCPSPGGVVLDIGHCVGSEGALMPEAVNGKRFSETAFWYQYALDTKRIIERAGFRCTICNRGSLPEDETLRGYACRGRVVHLALPDMEGNRRASRYHGDRVACGIVSADYAVWRQADCVVFLHHNSSSRGWSAGNETSVLLCNRYNGRALADAIAGRMNREVLNREFGNGKSCEVLERYEDAARGAGWLNVCDDSGIPAAIIEVAYLNNRNHAAYLTNDDNARHYAESVGRGVVDYLRRNRNAPRHVREDESQPDEGSFGYARESRMVEVPGVKKLHH